MDPNIISAIVTAGGALLGNLIEWVGRKDDAARKQVQEQAQVVIGKTYDTLKTNFTDGCVTVLKLIEDGNNHMPHTIRERMYPKLNLPQDVRDQFDGEFRYRLEYLRFHGVIAIAFVSEYGITSLGRAFLGEARQRHDYSKVLFDS